VIQPGYQTRLGWSCTCGARKIWDVQDHIDSDDVEKARKERWAGAKAHQLACSGDVKIGGCHDPREVHR
jgi:hypothetical protein